MRIENYRDEPSGDTREISATLNGLRLWYRVPARARVCRSGDVFLALALQPAMRLSEPVYLGPDLPVSARLLTAIERIQAIWTTWQPTWRTVPIECSVREAIEESAGIGSFFSGGVDGGYSLSRHRHRITHLVSVQGIGVALEAHSLWEEVIAANEATAAAFGAELVPVQTNVREWCRRSGVGWELLQGGAIASIAHLLGFRQCMIAATHTYAELFPWGSHLLVDPLWSTEATEIIHDGAEARRSEKLRHLAAEPLLVQNLRVCWQSRGYNCGTCEKCLRTRVTLQLLGLSTPTLPPLTDLRPVRALRFWTQHDWTYLDDNLPLAEASDQRVLAGALRACAQRNALRRWAGDARRLVRSRRPLKQVPPAQPIPIAPRSSAGR